MNRTFERSDGTTVRDQRAYDWRPTLTAMAACVAVVISLASIFVGVGSIKETVSRTVAEQSVLAREFETHLKDANEAKLNAFNRISTLEADSRSQTQLLLALNTKVDKILEYLLNNRKS